VSFAKQGFLRVPAVVADPPGQLPRQQLDGIVDVIDRINMKLTFPTTFHDVLTQHQIAGVGFGNHHTLVPGQTKIVTRIIKSLDLFIHTANRLQVPQLIDRAGDGHALIDRHIGERT